MSVCPTPVLTLAPVPRGALVVTTASAQKGFLESGVEGILMSVFLTHVLEGVVSRVPLARLSVVVLWAMRVNCARLTRMSVNRYPVRMEGAAVMRYLEDLPVHVLQASQGSSVKQTSMSALRTHVEMAAVWRVRLVRSDATARRGTLELPVRRI